MVASKWQSIPFFALLIISFAATNCVARQVDTHGKDIHKPVRPSPAGLSAALDSPYGWQYWQWSWGTPSPTWFPWGTSNLYCRPVGSCMGANCNGFYLEFDYDHIGFSYSYNYRRNEDSVKDNDKISQLEDVIRKSPEDGRSQADNDNDNNEKKNKRSHVKVIPRPN